jgi:hypothetical protein
MPLRFVCAFCQEPLKVSDELAGRKGRCPFCNAKMRIPKESNGIPELLEPGKPEMRKDAPKPEEPAPQKPGTTPESEKPESFGADAAAPLKTAPLPSTVSQETPESAPVQSHDAAKGAPATLDGVSSGENKSAGGWVGKEPDERSQVQPPEFPGGKSPEPVSEGDIAEWTNATFSNRPTLKKEINPFPDTLSPGMKLPDANAENQKSPETNVPAPQKDDGQKDGSARGAPSTDQAGAPKPSGEKKARSSDDDDFLFVDQAPAAPLKKKKPEALRVEDLPPTMQGHPSPITKEMLASKAPSTSDRDDFLFEDEHQDKLRAQTMPGVKSPHPMDTEPTQPMKGKRPVALEQPVGTSTEAGELAARPSSGESMVKNTLSSLDDSKSESAAPPAPSKAVSASLPDHRPKSAWGSFLLMTALVSVFLAGFGAILWHAVKEKNITRNESQARIRIRTLFSAQETIAALNKKNTGKLEYASSLAGLKDSGLLEPSFWSGGNETGAIEGYTFNIQPNSKSAGNGFIIVALPEEYGSTGRATILINQDGRLIVGDTAGTCPTGYPDTLVCYGATSGPHWYLER